MNAMGDGLLGLDVGGGSCRATLLEPDSRRVTTATRALGAQPVAGSGGLAFDLDLDAIWAALCDATREVLARSGVPPARVGAVAATAMRLGTVVLDARGQPLLAVPNRDARAVLPGLQLGAEHGEALAERTGRWPAPIFSGPRLLHLKNSEPQRFERAAHLLSISDWVTWKLCGQAVAEPSQAGESLLFDLGSRDWAWDWIDRFELPRHLFPPVSKSGDRAGELARESADALGLTAGIPVAIAGADTQCGLLAAGAVAAGDCAVVAGTTSPVEQVIDRALVDPGHHLWTGHHLVPGQYVLESNAGPAGETLAWFARLLFPDDPQPEARLLGEAATSLVGAAGLFSTFGAQVFDARALAIPVGSLTLTHLSSAPSDQPRRHLARAFAEGLAFAVRANLEQIARLTKREATSLRLAGGLARSPSFARLLADACELPVLQSATPDASSVGAALCAGVAIGRYASLEQAAADTSHQRIEPGPDASQSGSVYAQWNELRTAQASSQALAAGLITPHVLAAQTGAATPSSTALRPRVLICADFDAESLDALREFAEVEYAPFREKLRLLSGDALVDALADFDVFVTEIDLVDAAALARLPRLRVVGACRGDAVNVDVAACSAYGIPVVHAPGRNADAVADLTVAFLLMLARRFPAAGSFLRQDDIRAGDMGKMGQAFSTLRGRELWHKTIGLVGFGAVGRQVARRLQGFGAELIVADPFVDAEQAATAGARKVSLDELLAHSDFVSLHAAVVDDTRGLIDADALSRMKPGACLVNTARAALTDESALAAALADGRLSGAAFDTFAVEPPGSDHPLLQFDNVIATPHVGGNTEEVAAHQGRTIVAELRRLLAGERPHHALDASALDDFDWSAERRPPDAAALAALDTTSGPAVTDLQREEPRRAPHDPQPADADLPGAPADAGPASTDGGGANADVARIRRDMQALLEHFIAACARDDGMARFAIGRDVTLHFELSDLDLEFHLQVREGELGGALGAPAERAPVELRMRASVLDGMFSGRGDPMRDAMEGRLSFTGDAAKAMALQEMQADLQRVYQQSIAALGAPSELDALDAEAQLAPDATADDVCEQIVAAVGELYAADLITATGGNVSARCSAGAGELWITPSQLFKGDLRSEALVRIDLEGRPRGGATRSPSSEWGMHCAVYAARPDVNAVIHAHAPHATILANTGLPFLPISTEAAFFGEIPRIPFVMPGTTELAEAIGEALADGWAVLMQNHGLLVAGRSLRRAADMAEIIERSAEVILGCYAVGREPPVLPDDVVAELRRMGDLVA